METKATMFGKALLRYTFIAVFTYFSLMQFIEPSMWTSFVPSWATASGLSAGTLVTLNAILEILGVVFLIFNTWTKWVCIILALHLLGIAASIGWNPIGVRDIGLGLSVLASVFLVGIDNNIFAAC